MKLPENQLTAEQEKLWEKTRKELEKLYATLKLTAKPLSMEKVKAIRIPSNIAEEGSMPLPWDVQLLLNFDQNLTLAPEDNEFPLLGEAASGVLCNTDMLIELLSDLSNEEPNPHRGKKAFLEQAGDLPPLIDLPQLGGDELPMLWPILPRDQCSIVLHLDTDGSAEFYVRSTSLFNYVIQYLASASNPPETIEDTRTDISQIWSEKKDVIVLDRIESKMELLNDSLFNMIDSLFRKKNPIYNFDDEDDDASYDGDDDDRRENDSFDDEEEDDYYSNEDDDSYDDDDEEDYDEYEEDEYDDEDGFYEDDDESFDEDM
jgi:hypothetical protein